jgi:hypothetical protein
MAITHLTKQRQQLDAIFLSACLCMTPAMFLPAGVEACHQ